MVPIKEISVKKMKNDRRKQRYYCRECGYKSGRRFNVERHANRIHGESIDKECCDIKFFKKSDYYHHVEDHHPRMRSSCFVSKEKYKIYGRRMKLLTDYYYKTTTVNSGNVNDEPTAIRKSKRIQEQVITRGKSTIKETPTDSECDADDDDDDDMDIDYYDYESEGLTNNSHNYQRMNSLSSAPEEYGSSKWEGSENKDDSTDDDYFQDHIDGFGAFRHQTSNSDTMKHENAFQSFLVDTKINVQKNINTGCRLPLKKRILCEINNNVDVNSIPKNDKIKIKRTSYADKENQNPIDIYLYKDHGATIIKQKLNVEQSIQMWKTITQRQRDYLKYIDFNSF